MAVETAPAPMSYDEWRDRRWRLTGLLFALAWLVVAVAVLGGERRSDLDTLVADVRNGSVTSVELTTLHGDDAGDRVELVWQDGIVQRFAVVQVDLSTSPKPYTTGDRITTIPIEFLLGLDPDLEITHVSPRPSGSTEWRGWQFPEGIGVLALGAWVGTFLLLGAGPQPWRATRWAWGWFFLLAGPLGSVAYLLLGGPLGVARPRHPNRRLTGGWAFLLAMIFFGGTNTP